MEGFKVYFQCWLVVDVNLAAVFFDYLLPPATIEPAITLPLSCKATIEDTDHKLVVWAKRYGLLTTRITSFGYRALECR